MSRWPFVVVFLVGCGPNPPASTHDLGPAVDMVPLPSHCSDKAKNNDETDVDCGGSCSKCPDGKVCKVDGDCASGSCAAGTCAEPVPPKCDDKIANGAETDVDCGGPVCPACVSGLHCKLNSDCISSKCTNLLCAPMQQDPCTDGMLDGQETDVDCGGLQCATKCTVGKNCHVSTDCDTGLCSSMVCTAKPPTCFDGVMNGAETDVDCGGMGFMMMSSCPKCPVTKKCTANSDCTSASCVNNVCAAGVSCNNGKKDGSETDIDCGGPMCPQCANGKACLLSMDCVGGECNNKVCAVAPNCHDGVMNGPESDVDCGGGNCPGCADTLKCRVNGDCLSMVCTNLVCVPAPSCMDKVKNGAETDIDCGGQSCPGCANGLACKIGRDCASKICSIGMSPVCTAAPASCMNGKKDLQETDVDCGGRMCPPCGVGQACMAPIDCTTVLCVMNVCK